MTNAQILAASLNEWASPIIEGAINQMAKDSQVGYLMSELISPQRLIKSLQQYIAIPILQENLTKIPDALIPEVSLDIVDGFIEARVERGALYVPFINTTLGANAFRGLKKILESNLKEYGEVATEGANETTEATEATEDNKITK